MIVESLLYNLARDGYRIWAEGDKLAIVPTLDSKAIREHVLANKSAIVDYLQSLPHPPTFAHPFTTLIEESEKVLQLYGCCIACGYSWDLHGQPPEQTWRRVVDPDSVAQIKAYGILFSGVEAMISAGIA